MKKTLALVLALLMLFSTAAGVALAEDREPLRETGSMIGAPYWRKKGINFVEFCNYDIWAPCITWLEGKKPPDMAGIYTSDEDFQLLKGTGLLADLSSSELIRQYTARLRPELKALVTTEDGRILGVPTDSTAWPVYWCQEAWDAAGLTAEDVPQSYTELLTFLEKWVERIKAKPEKNVCVAAYASEGGGPAKYNYVYWLLSVLLESWEMQAFYAGEPLNFETPEFIELLKRTREVGIALYKVEPNGKKRAKMLKLFDRYHEGLDGMEYGIAHTVPSRITADQPMLVRNSATIYMVREGSQWKAECITALEDRLLEDDRATILYADLYADILPGEYRFWNDDIGKVTAAYLKDFETYEGHIIFPVLRTSFQYERLIKKFKDGDMKAEKFAAQISKPKRDPNKETQ